MLQLKMLRPSAAVTPRALPAGYTVSMYRGTEAELAAWLDMCFKGQLLPENPPESGSYRDWFKVTVLDYADLNPDEDIIFILDPVGIPVASICAVQHGEDQGYIHMVAVHPDSRGKGIGHAMLAVALEKLEARGCMYSILTTDDFRLPAIKTYLDAGFRPVLRNDPDSDQRARWDAVIAALSYEPVEYFTEM
ncbi:MAG: GNAT family N-acetyltransferase [Clostridia bacterium]|nr:GNAT family N-acetyltransferase [Clostridia bacterium]